MKRLVVFTLLSLLFQIDLLAQYNIPKIRKQSQ